jgi:hypothetical protein
MTCEHLRELEVALIAKGVRVTYRGQPWSSNCREWVYFDAHLDTLSISKNFSLPPCVMEHVHQGTHDGEERGFVCTLCHDAVIGLLHPQPGKPIFPTIEQ